MKKYTGGENKADAFSTACVTLKNLKKHTMNKATHFFTLILLFLLGTINTFATTWNEPWADQVIKEADYFVLADIISYDEEKGIKIKITKQFGGTQLPSQIEITGFYLLETMSISGGHGAEFPGFEDTKQSYFFIKKNSKGQFCISTPTSGFDPIKNGKVYATYRHSYHLASVPIDIYEMTMTAIFNNYHHLEYDKKSVANYIEKSLSTKPAGFDEDEINTFFLQHVALETIFHLRLDGYYDLILPFFNDSSNFHHRVSAARAFIAYKNKEVTNLLLNKIASHSEDDFTTVICIWTLKEFKPKEIKTDLEKLISTASTADNGFGGNIMDPRVGTHFPTVKSALEDLISTL